MSSGDIENTIYRPTEDRLFNLYAQHRDLYQWMQLPYRINHEHHVPFIGGIAEQGDPVYIDFRLGLMQMIQGKHVNIAKYIAVHERLEWWLVKNLKMVYEQAHIWANTAECWAVEQDGLRYSSYNFVVERNVKKIEGAALTRLPRDLAKYPYADDKKILEAIRRAV